MNKVSEGNKDDLAADLHEFQEMIRLIQFKDLERVILRF